MPRRAMIVPEIVPQDENETEEVFAVRSIADVPRPGTCVKAGEPVMTMLAAGEDLTSCQVAYRSDSNENGGDGWDRRRCSPPTSTLEINPLATRGSDVFDV